jgi:hypothetical protein
MKKIKKYSLNLSLLLFTLLSSVPSHAYSDVHPNDWSYQAITELTNKYGILSGYPNGQFKPKKNITREETAAELYKLAQWVDNHPTSVSVEDMQRISAMLGEYKNELWQLQNQVRAMYTDQEMMKSRIEEIDARLDWNLKNRGLLHMTAMSTGKAVVGAGKDIATVGKGVVWLATFGNVNLFNNPNKPPEPVSKINRYNGPIQFLNGSSF